jgi:bleomycin hydrolase
VDLFVVHFGELKSDFKHDDHYDVEVKGTPDVKDQCSTSHCHMYAWESELEHSSGIPVSNTYLDAMRLYDQALIALKEGKTSLDLGSYAFESRNSIRKYGIVPETVAKDNNRFTDEPMYTHLESALESILVRVAWIKENGKDRALLKAAREEARIEILAMIENVAGAFPKQFEYENKIYTPRTFAKAFFPELYEPIIDVRMDRRLTVVEGKSTDARISLKMNFIRAEILMRQVIDAGRPVYISYRHNSQFIDTETGIMSISGFAYPSMAEALPAGLMTKYSKWGGGHAVLVVGYELDAATGRVRKWKIQNSWGDDSGDTGFYHMYADYFDRFVWGFTFVNDKNIPLPKIYPAKS